LSAKCAISVHRLVDLSAVYFLSTPTLDGFLPAICTIVTFHHGITGI